MFITQMQHIETSFRASQAELMVIIVMMGCYDHLQYMDATFKITQGLSHIRYVERSNLKTSLFTLSFIFI